MGVSRFPTLRPSGGLANRKPVEVVVQGWPTVYMRPMSGNERDALEVWRDENRDDLTGFRARVVSYCLCDSEGNSLEFTAGEVVRLGEKNGGIIDHLCSRGLAMSQFTEGDVRKLEGN